MSERNDDATVVQNIENIENAENVEAPDAKSIDERPGEDDDVDEPTYAENAPGEQTEPGDDEDVEDRTPHTDESDLDPDAAVEVDDSPDPEQ